MQSTSGDTWRQFLLMIKKIFLLLTLFCCREIASATTHYVTPSGGSLGTTGVDWSHAFASLPASLVRGDTYVLAGGTYSTQINLGDACPGCTTSSGTYIHIRKAQAGTYNGTAYNDDLVAGWQSAFQTIQVLISRACTVMNINTAYYDIDGVTPGNTWPPPNTASSYGIEVTTTGTTNCTLMDVGNGSGLTATNERFQHIAYVSCGQSCNVQQWALVFYNANNSYVAHNLFINSQNHVRMNSSLNIIIEYNYLGIMSSFPSFHNEMLNMLTAVFAGSPRPSNTTIRYNWFNDSGTPGETGEIIDLQTTGATNDGVFVYGNVLLNLQGHNGIGSGNSGNPASLTNWKFYNNTFINSVIDFSDLSTGSEWRNNIVYGGSAQTVFGGGISALSNNYYNSTSNSLGSGSGDVISTESTSVLFQNYSGGSDSGDYRLGSSSQARNIGFTLSSPYNVDPFGTTRVPGSWDAGAFQTPSNSLLPPTNLTATPQ